MVPLILALPSRGRKSRKKRQEEYVLNRDYELESSRVWYDADAKQRRASARDMYRANLESNRAYKRRRHEQNSDKIRASKRLKSQANRETNRASQRSLYWRNSSAALTAKRAQ